MKHVGITATIASDVWEKTTQYAGKCGLNKSQFINFALQYYLNCIDAGVVQPMLYASTTLPTPNPAASANSYDGKTVAQIVAEQKKSARAAVMTPSEIAEMEEIERKGSYDPDLERELENRKIVLANSLN